MHSPAVRAALLGDLSATPRKDLEAGPPVLAGPKRLTPSSGDSVSVWWCKPLTALRVTHFAATDDEYSCTLCSFIGHGVQC